MRPKRSLGQNFLIDPNTAAKIAGVLKPVPGDEVVEIGPGRGALTKALIKTGARITCVEMDEALAASLRETLKDEAGLNIITADALEFSFVGLSQEIGRKLKLVANLPYNISGPLFAKLLDERAAFSAMTLMFQREVAERIAAGPGTKEYGVLSVFARAFTDVNLEFNVPPHLFRPVPAVMSTVVSFKILDEPRVHITDEAWFKRVVKAAFGQRRKTALNALSTLGLDKKKIETALSSVGIDLKRRGETFSVEEFARLADVLRGQNR